MPCAPWVPGSPVGPGSPLSPLDPVSPFSPWAPVSPLGPIGPTAPMVAVMNVQRPNELVALGKDCIHKEYDPASSPGGSSATMAVGAKLSTLSCIPPSSTTGVAPTP